jgi:SMC interacting uncharacterized protein involved in chromosome segregation
MNKLETLQSNLTARDEEIMGYQINIDNFTRAIAKIDLEHLGNVPMQQFRDQLQSNLDSSLIEQLKSKIIREVIADQLQELESL